MLITPPWVTKSDPDFVSQTDLLHQISILEDNNKKAEKLVRDLSVEEGNLIKDVQDIVKEISQTREKFNKLEDENMNHQIKTIERSLDIMGDKQM